MWLSGCPSLYEIFAGGRGRHLVCLFLFSFDLNRSYLRWNRGIFVPGESHGMATSKEEAAASKVDHAFATPKAKDDPNRKLN
jgi:hypothetical protein